MYVVADGAGDKLAVAAARPSSPPPPHVDAARLTASMAAGDPSAVEAFYRGYFDRLLAEARRATRRDESFCLDVVQEAVLRIVRTVRQTESEAQLASWLRLVVRTTAYDLLRADRRRAAREVASRRAEAAIGAPAMEGDEQLAWLRQKIAALDPQIVRMIELRVERRWTLGRIGRALGLSIGTVDGRLRRALAALRDAADEDGHA